MCGPAQRRLSLRDTQQQSPSLLTHWVRASTYVRVLMVASIVLFCLFARLLKKHQPAVNCQISAPQKLFWAEIKH